MEVGCLGNFTFEVSSSEIKTISAFSWSSSAKYTEHSVIGSVGMTEKTGISPDKVTLSVKLSAYLGVDPIEEYRILRGYARSGTRNRLVIGDEKIGDQWVVTQSQFSAEHYDRDGNVTSADVSLTLQEYR